MSLFWPKQPKELPIQCSLITVSLDDCPEYLALSYTWGEPDFTRKIAIDDREVDITENLFIALQHLRRPDESVTLWIDAICVNQSPNNPEKGTQIRQMRHIYEQAKSVIVFLGPEADESDKVMDFLAGIGRIADEIGIAGISRKQFIDVSMNPKNPFSKEIMAKLELCYEKMDRIFYDEFPLDGYRAFIKRKWWRRVWVVQEFSVARAPVFVCGKKSLESRFFDNASTVLWYFCWTAMDRSGYIVHDEQARRKQEMLHVGLTNSAMDLMLSLRRHFQQFRLEKKEQRTLLSLLKQTAILEASSTKFEATDKRDMVFGLLGLAADSDVLDIPVDYSTRTTPEDVFISASKEILNTKKLDILAFRSPSGRTKTLPSWACDWSADLCGPFGDSTHIDRPFHASGNSTAKLSFPNYPQDRILCLEGFRVGEVSEISYAPTRKEVQSDGNVQWMLVEEFVSSAEGAFRKQQGLSEEDIVRTLIGDYDVFGIGESRVTARVGRATSACLEEYHKFKKWLGFAKENAAIEQAKIDEAELPSFSPQLTRRIEAFEQSVAEYANTLTSAGAYWSALSPSLDRKPFCLKEGYIGLGPIDITIGDTVCVFLGGDLPFVLRPLHGGKWRLLGEAYCHNIMDGELMNAQQETEEFKIC